MNKFLTLLVVSILVLPLMAFADSDTHGQPLDEVAAEIMAAQNVNVISDIDCDVVSDKEFEELGEAFMSVMHPDPEIHERMDAMMGGEGSETLRSAHIQMGRNYLGCGNGIGQGMMGLGMMGSNLMFDNDKDYSVFGRRYGHMGFPFMSEVGIGNVFTGWIMMILFWALVILGVIFLIRTFTDKGQGSEPLDILKSRYAKGEITKAQFEEMKKNIN